MFRSCRVAAQHWMVNWYKYSMMSDSSHPACVQHGKPRMVVAVGTNQYCQWAARCQGLDSDQCVPLALAWDLVRAGIGRQSTPGSKSHRPRAPEELMWIGLSLFLHRAGPLFYCTSFGLIDPLNTTSDVFVQFACLNLSGWREQES